MRAAGMDFTLSPEIEDLRQRTRAFIEEQALPLVAWATVYEEAARSVFGPLAINCSAPDDGNMNLLARIGTPSQKEWWLRPIVEGRVKSAFAMTEPAPGGGSVM